MKKPTLTLVSGHGAPQLIEFDQRDRRTVLELLTSAGLAGLTDSECGGAGTCGGCRVRVVGEAPPPSETDEMFLTSGELAQGVRLACELCPQSDVTIAPLVASAPGFKDGLAVGALRGTTGSPSGHTADPVVRKAACALPAASLDDQRSDWECLNAALDAAQTHEENAAQSPSEAAASRNQASLSHRSASLQALRALPAARRSHGGVVTAVLYSDTAQLPSETVIAVEPGDTSKRSIAAAVDIGTTTVAVYLMDLIVGRQLAVTAGTNPQTGYGGDVISRISAIVSTPAALPDMQRLVVEAINGWVAEAAGRAGLDPGEIYEIVVAGNTCMMHIFAGVDPRHIAAAPFVPAFSQEASFPAKELGLALHSAAQVCLLPCVSGYVGADIVADILATELHRLPGVRLLIDIGTNGEIVLARDGEIITCATAAGPAFEGAQIECGMRAAPGAIDHVSRDGELRATVIGGGLEARGICGSGLLDAAAAMVEAGIVEPSGRFQRRERLPAPLSERWMPAEGGLPAFQLALGSQRPVYLSQSDIRQLQMAKGATRAGIEIMLRDFHLGYEEIDEVLLAGAFGSFIDPASALAIGLLPPVQLGRVRAVGNTAGGGACLAALSARARAEATRIARMARYVELSTRPDFNRLFLQMIPFPKPTPRSLPS